MSKRRLMCGLLNEAVYVVLGLVTFALLISGCGGGGGGSSAAALDGTFVDSAVEGLEYITDTQSGITDMDGTFSYVDGEMVTFYLGDVIIGEAPGQPVMTPVDLVEGATDETHPTVINMIRFLQTLDADMDSANGITITEEMADLMLNRMIDFDMDPGEFEHTEDMNLVMIGLTEMYPFGPMRMLVSVESAQEHLRTTMNDMMGDVGKMPLGKGMME
jgi:hypothetical protein